MALSLILNDRQGNQKHVCVGDKVWDTLDQKLVRFGGLTGMSSVKVTDKDTGKELPDERHITQIFAL